MDPVHESESAHARANDIKTACDFDEQPSGMHAAHLVLVREDAQQLLPDHQAEYRIAQELEALVGERHAAPGRQRRGARQRRAVQLQGAHRRADQQLEPPPRDVRQRRRRMT